jgi:hypothetical protein
MRGRWRQNAFVMRHSGKLSARKLFLVKPSSKAISCRPHTRTPKAIIKPQYLSSTAHVCATRQVAYRRSLSLAIRNLRFLLLNRLASISASPSTGCRTRSQKLGLSNQKCSDEPNVERFSSRATYERQSRLSSALFLFARIEHRTFSASLSED